MKKAGRHILVWFCIVVQIALAAGMASAAVLCVAKDHAAVEAAHISGLCESSRSQAPGAPSHAIASASRECDDTPLFVGNQAISSERQTPERPALVFLPSLLSDLGRSVLRPSAVPASPPARPESRARSSVVLLI